MVNETVDENTVDISDNLDEFSEDFFNPKPLKEVEETVEESEEEEASAEEIENLETEEDENAEETEEEDDDSEEEEKPEPKVKKRHSAQKRFDELTAKVYEAQREVEALRRENETLRAVREKEEPKPLRTQLPNGAPDPDAKSEDGSPLYELGEFDPKYIHDLTKFTIETETKAAREKQAQEDWEAGVRAAQEELSSAWVDKLDKAEEEIPTIREDIVELTDTFQSIDPNYGEYLAMTIMSCENGPEIMHYFSQHIGEAQKIVAAGPAAATLAIGRLEAKLSKSSTKQDEQKRNKTVSKAPKPPEKNARGVNGRQTVRGDTENLDAFSDMFFKKK